MKSMFWICESLKEIDLSAWDVRKICFYDSMFSYCLNLKKVDLTGWDTSSAQFFTQMFSNCKQLEEIKGVIDVTHAMRQNMTSMFYNCPNLKKVKIRAQKSQKSWFCQETGAKPEQIEFVE